jgi:hypothetical protein
MPRPPVSSPLQLIGSREEFSPLARQGPVPPDSVKAQEHIGRLDQSLGGVFFQQPINDLCAVCLRVRGTVVEYQSAFSMLNHDSHPCKTE